MLQADKKVDINPTTDWPNFEFCLEQESFCRGLIAPGTVKPGLSMWVPYKGIQAIPRNAHPRPGEPQNTKSQLFKHHGLQVVGTQRYQSLVINKSSSIPTLILCTAAGVPFPWGSPPESSAVQGIYSGLKVNLCLKSCSHISSHARACLQCLQQPPVPFFLGNVHF